MSSRVYIGETWHCRYAPKRHEFTYPLYFFSLDLGELDQLNASHLLFGYNRFAPFSVFDRDYLDESGHTLKEKVTGKLREKGIEAPKRVVLITTPRFFGYIFNPVSFYFCLNECDELIAFIAEVNNTFDEKHAYVLPPPEQSKDIYRFRFPKAFYVSPFFDVTGEYEITVRERESELDIRVNILEDNDEVFASQLRGDASPVSSRVLAWLLVSFPLSAWLTMSRIIFQAGLLYFRKKLPVWPKPVPEHIDTLRHGRAGLFARIRAGVISVARKAPGEAEPEVTPENVNVTPL